MSTIYRPKPIIFKPNDPFFKEGNIALKAIWLQKQAESDLEIQLIKEEEASLTKFIPIFCEKCNLELASALAYELHYEVMHRNVCSVCQKIFPNAYWLSLHIDEFHNILVQMKKERGEKTYKCLVEGCKYVGARPRNRNEHLRKQHSFPDYFPFQITMTGANNIIPSVAMCNTDPTNTKIINKKEIHKERRQRQKRHKQICKGDINMQDVSIDQDNEEGIIVAANDQATVDVDLMPVSDNSSTTATLEMDIDNLTLSMSKLKIPRQVLFGRGKSKPSFRSKQRH